METTNDDNILCCANCYYADGKRIKKEEIRCQYWHKYKKIDDFCKHYDYGTEWYGR